MPTTLVLGAAGSIGSALTIELLRRRQSVRVLVRDESKLRAQLGSRARQIADIAVGSVLDPKALAQAAAGCDTIVHAVNLPYAEWSPGMETLTTNVIAAAEQAAASEPVTILFPGNVYNLGPPAAAPFSEGAPNNTATKKGQVRARIENALRHAAENGSRKVRTLIVRAGDYFGPTIRNGAVDPIFANAAEKKPIKALGNLDAAHQWVFAPDLARAMLDLLALRARFSPFEVVNFAGYSAKSSREFLRLIAQRAGRDDLPVSAYPWWLVKLFGVFAPQAREVVELRYLWDSAVLLDGSRFKSLLPEFAHTPIDLAIDETLAAYRDEFRAANPAAASPSTQPTRA